MSPLWHKKYAFDRFMNFIRDIFQPGRTKGRSGRDNRHPTTVGYTLYTLVRRNRASNVVITSNFIPKPLSSSARNSNENIAIAYITLPDAAAAAVAGQHQG